VLLDAEVEHNRSMHRRSPPATTPMGRARRPRPLVSALVAGIALVVGACGSGNDDATVTDADVRPFSEVQAGEFVFEPDPLDPARGIFRVETTEAMICAIVWGETDQLGRFNNALSMNGTGITEHDVVLPDVEPGRAYHFIVQGTTADGTLYRSPPATFEIPVLDREDTASPTASADVGENLALDATVVEVSSEFSASFAGALAIDGDLATEWSTAGDGDDGSITIDLGAPQDIAGVEFVTRSMADGSAVTSTFTVRVDDGEPLGPFPAASPATSRITPLELSGQAVRFDVEQSSGGNVGAVEIRVFGPSR
jgi:F5/8 type C domain